MRKLLIIQFDGVSYPVMNLLIKRGYLPYIKSMIHDDGYHVHELFAGIPCTTPAAQMGILYGVGDLFTGFWIYDKSHRRFIAAKAPETIPIIERVARSRRKESLADITDTISIIFGGKSKDSVAVSRLTKRFYRDPRMLQLLFTYVRNPVRLPFLLLRMAVLATVARHQGKIAARRGMSERYTRGLLLGRIAEEGLVGEVAHFYTKRSLKHKKPVVYTDFVGYDNLAHHVGPFDRFTLMYASLFDSYVRSLMGYIQRHNLEYEVVILSDHGQTPSTPISEREQGYIGDIIRGMYPGVHIAEQRSGLVSTVSRDTDLVVINSGGLASIYNVADERRQARSQLETAYPDFCEKMSNVPSVGFVLARDHGKEWIIRDGKTMQLTKRTVSEVVKDISPNVHEKVLNQMKKILHSPYAADVYLFASMIEKNHTVSFEPQWGTHGGIGGDQTRNFIMTKRIPIDPDSVEEMADLHDIFYRFVQEEATD